MGRLHRLQSPRRGASPKHWAGLRGSAFLPAVFVLAACAFVAEETQARPPADRNESAALSLGGGDDEMSQMLEHQKTVQEETKQSQISQDETRTLSIADSVSQDVFNLLR